MTELSRDQRIALHRRAVQNPVWWAETVFGVQLEWYQKEVLQILAETPIARVAFRSCHGVGKTFIAALAVLWFFANFTNARIITSAPTWHQIGDVLWPEIGKLHHAAHRSVGGGHRKSSSHNTPGIDNSSPLRLVSGR